MGVLGARDTNAFDRPELAREAFGATAAGADGAIFSNGGGRDAGRAEILGGMGGTTLRVGSGPIGARLGAGVGVDTFATTGGSEGGKAAPACNCFRLAASWAFFVAEVIAPMPQIISTTIVPIALKTPSSLARMENKCVPIYFSF